MAETKTPGPQANEIPDSAITVDDDGNQRDLDERLLHRRQRFEVMQTFWSEIHTQGLKDDKMVAGEQWPEEIRKERQEDRRPILTYNMLPAFNRQITNKIRQERPSVKVTPVETNRGADPRIGNMTGTKDYSVADIYAGIIKNIEHTSRADQAYDTATKHAVDHGFGYFYMLPTWSKIDPFVQELRIHRVKNSYSVMLDPDSQEADYRDMQDAFMFSNMARATYRAKYPETPYTEFADASMGSSYEGWYDTETVRIAQYFWLDHKQDSVILLSNGKVVYQSDVEEILDDLERETGIHVQKNAEGRDMIKPVKRPVCMWEKITARDILEGPLELPFSSVPIYPVFGEEIMVDGRMRYESAIRHAIDPQKSYNYWRTAATEAVALAPRAPWMITERQLAGHEKLYETANVRNLPYLIYNHVEGVPPPQRVFSANVAAAELQNATQDGVDMQTIIGLHDASLGKESNEKSGRAIIARQNAGTTATFQFPDNLGRALEQMGRNAVEAIPKITDTRRQVRIRLPDDSSDFIEVNQAVMDEATGKEYLLHDIAYGKYDVTLETGPSYATQRQEAADLQMELLKILDPEAARSIVHIIVQNLGVPGSEEVARVLRKMLPEQLKTEEEKLADLPKGVTKDDNGQLVDENGDPWQPEPTLEQQIAMKQQELDEAEHNAELAKHQATSDKAEADKAEAQAELAKVQQEMAALQAGGPDQGQQQQQQQEMIAGIQETIRTVMEEHVNNPNAHDAMEIEEKIAAAIVEALTRVRGYVDRSLKAGQAGPPEPGPGDRQPAEPMHRGPGAKQEFDLNLNLDRQPTSISHEYDGAGNIIKSIPMYDDANAERDDE